MDKIINYKERVATVKAMDAIVRSLNDEGYLMNWLELGVPDGEVDDNTRDEDLYWLVENNDDFGDLMHTFVCIMKSQPKNNAMYVDGVFSTENQIF